MPKPIPTPPSRVIRQIFEYRDGDLIWRPRDRSSFTRPCDYARWLNQFEGRAAGHTEVRGYRQIRLSSPAGSYMAHRLVWAYHHGAIGEGLEIDHIDGNPANNRLENLRCVPHSENLRNRAKLRSNTSGSNGVAWLPERKKWRARSFVGGSKHLGYFDAREDAEKAIGRYQAEMGCTERHGA